MGRQFCTDAGLRANGDEARRPSRGAPASRGALVDDFDFATKKYP
jgi:hypothetical protein